MKKLALYPAVTVAKQDYSGVKEITVPKQSLTLRQIIERFTRKEALPIEKEGFYSDQYGDLEKLLKKDITVRHEYVEKMRARLDKIEAALNQQKKDAENAAIKQAVDEGVKKALESGPSGGSGVQPPVTGTPVGPQAPGPSLK